MKERGGIYRAVVGEPEGKRPLGRLWGRWEHNIIVGLGGMEWNDLAQYRDSGRALVKAVMNFWIP